MRSWNTSAEGDSRLDGRSSQYRVWYTLMEPDEKINPPASGHREAEFDKAGEPRRTSSGNRSIKTFSVDMLLLYLIPLLFFGMVEGGMPEQTGRSSPVVDSSVEETSDSEIIRQWNHWKSSTPASRSHESWEPVAGKSRDLLVIDMSEAMRRQSEEVRLFLDQCDQMQWPTTFLRRLPEIPSLPAALKPYPLMEGLLLQRLAESLLHTGRYAEAASVLQTITPERMIDPAATLFARAVAAHRLLDRAGVLEAIDRFHALPFSEKQPKRYRELLKLLEAVWEEPGGEDGDLENIARQMQGVKLRLGNGRTDKDVQRLEGDLLKSLDKEIEKLEGQCKKCAGENDSLQSNKPADDSRIMRGKGPGQVQEKDIGSLSGWGDLPPKEREEALLRFEKEFPSHYRTIIESYFREMAAGEKAGN